MPFVAHPALVPLEKRLIPKQRAVFGAAARVEGEIAKHVKKALLSLRDRVPIGELAKMLDTATIADVWRKTNGGGIEAIASGLSEELNKGLVSGGRLAAKEMGKIVVLDPMRPAVRKWVDDHLLELAKQLSDTSRAAISNTLRDGITRGRHPGQIAKDIRRSLGLTERQGTAVSRYWGQLQKEGVPYAKIEQRAQKYSERLIGQRARTIARTESISAVSQGRAQLWQQLKDEDAFPEGYVQEWLTAGDDRVSEEICAPMQGQQRPIGEPFTTGDGQKIDAPPSHPNCRCTVVLVQEGRKR